MKLQKKTTKQKIMEKEEVRKTQKQPTVTTKTENKIFQMKLNLLIHQKATKI